MDDLDGPEPAVSNPRRSVREAPQTSIDKFWSSFTTKYPGTVHRILPSDIFAKKKALKADKGLVTGTGAVTSYEQAASECKRAVEKIAKECRRVNKKYRDQHFDIEVDLKGSPEPRNCLDGLGYNPQNLSPKSVKRVPVS